MTPPQPALRPYLESIEQQCQLLDRNKLIQLILDLAKQATPGKRNDFLENFHSILPAEDKQTTTDPETDLADLQAEIEELHEIIRDRVISINDGSYWDDPDDDDWEDSYYLDNDPEPMNHEQTAALTDLFSEADHHFIHGEKTAAKIIYSGLFAIIEEIEEYGLSADLEFDLRETRARMARCVYELSSPEERIDAMLAVMHASQFENDLNEFDLHNFPLLQDILDAESDDLSDFDSFLASWHLALSKLTFRRNRIADLLLEAVFLQSGSEAVGALARKWQNEQPRGYLYWLQQLEREKNWPALRVAGLESLPVLPPGRNRVRAADFLITTATHLGDDATSLIGFRERFRSKPCDSTLLDLLTEANRQQVRAQELEEVCIFCAKTKPESGEQLLLVKALLMAGRIDQAFALCKQDKIFGWSYGATGLLFASALYLLCNGNSTCSLIHQQLEDYGGCHTIFFDSYSTQPIKESRSGFEEIKHGLNLVDTDSKSLDLDSYRKWAGTIGEQRVNHIVSNTHRSAYDRAATVLGSLAETMAANGDKKKAQALLHEYCKVLYNRHTAFRREVREAVGLSEILGGLGGGL
ncbi:MAG: hypothetical protein GY799_28025 [Desulfobulbaceae bacterium]|nr:hypothetical protein [Desulfobulbaceae bacterium]